MSIELSVSLNPSYNDLEDLQNAVSYLNIAIDKLKSQKELERKKRELKKEKNKPIQEKPISDDQVKCVCGTTVKKDGIKKHEKTKNHIKFVGAPKENILHVFDLEE